MTLQKSRIRKVKNPTQTYESDNQLRSSLAVPENQNHEGGSKESQKSTHRKLKSYRIEENDLDLKMVAQLEKSMENYEQFGELIVGLSGRENEEIDIHYFNEESGMSLNIPATNNQLPGNLYDDFEIEDGMQKFGGSFN